MARVSVYREVLPFTALVMAETGIVVSNTLFKAATSKGISFYVFNFYTYAIASLVLLPFPFIFPSTTALPPIKFPLLFRISVLALIGSCGNILGYKGIEYSSPTLASAMSNLTPAFTFLLAVIFRMEKLVWRSSSTQAKIIGTILSISGALLVVLYGGPTILWTNPSPPLQLPLVLSQSNWVIGGLLVATQYFLFSIWNIFQTKVIKIYPAELIVSSIYYLCAVIASAPICSIAETNLSAWIPRSDIALIAIAYSGLFASPFSTLVHTWGFNLRGPVYVAAFKPLSIAVAAVMGVIFLGDALHIGSVIGAIVIGIGFYAVLWGKATEEEVENCGFSNLGPESNHTIALLHNHKVEDM